MKRLWMFLSGVAVCGAAHADLLVAKAAKGTLSVQYEYSTMARAGIQASKVPDATEGCTK